ncbi:MAG: aldo/keto reductase [Betaproteobacteria bacterium]
MTEPINLTLPDGASMPGLGLGTWRMGERRDEHAREVAALKLGLALGIKLIDTAEMYGEGGAEEIVAEAIADARTHLFVVSKVYPHNATRRGALAACKRTLERLRTDYLDLYLLHWRGDVPLAQTVAAFEELRAEGKIRAWGVSNFDVADMKELLTVSGGGCCAANQVLYNLGRRGVEYDLLPFCRERSIAVMAYSPVDQGRLLRNRALAAVAKQEGVSPAQVAIAWLLRRGVSVIPKASEPDHVREIRAAADLALCPASDAALVAAFPPPTRRTPLAML